MSNVCSSAPQVAAPFAYLVLVGFVVTPPLFMLARLWRFGGSGSVCGY
jgi:hypothetical protein